MVKPWGGCAGSHGAQRALDLGCGGASLRARVFLGKLSIAIEYTLTKRREIIEGISGMSINCDVSPDTRREPSFEVEAGPVHVNNVFANLGNNSLEFSMVFKNGTGALCHALDGETKLTSVIRAGEACLERLDEFIESGELGGRRVFCHEPEFGRADKEGRRGFHLFFFIRGCPDVCTNFEDPGIDDGEGRVLS
ncbi:MAG TPA: hypothetical protein VMP68_11245 [Candidatus Eisenbacteria bacterium]|nr:hypothetical protein [Candidatus Eisenbacteria bacterium]